MGCWAFGIYQSDDSMDWECDLHDQADVDPYEDDFDPQTPAVRAAFEKALPAMLEGLAARSETASERSGFYKAVGYQMLACLLMRYGCTISDADRQAIIAGILACPEYQQAKELLVRSGGATFSTEVLKEAGVPTGMLGGYTGIINRWTGRIGALERLAKEFGEYDAAGGKPYDYKDQGSLELEGQPEQDKVASNYN